MSKRCAFSFKQISVNIKQKFELSSHLIDGERLLPVVVGVVSAFG